MATDPVKLKNEIIRLINKRDLLSRQVTEKSKELKSICPHTETDIHERYVPGGYLDREEYHTTEVCMLCGTELHHTMTTGGFG